VIAALSFVAMPIQRPPRRERRPIGYLVILGVEGIEVIKFGEVSN
jgi:hypothetical protein